MGELFKWLLDLIKGANPLLVVAPWEQATLVRGRWSWERRPGIWWKIPWLDKVYLLTCRRRTAAFNRASFDTCDGHTLTLSGAIVYTVTSVTVLMNYTDMGEDLLMKKAGDLCREYVELLPKQLVRACEMKPYVIARMNKELEGLHVHEVLLPDFSFMPVLHLVNSQAWGNTYQGGVLNTSTPLGKTA